MYKHKLHLSDFVVDFVVYYTTIHNKVHNFAASYNRVYKISTCQDVVDFVVGGLHFVADHLQCCSQSQLSYR